MSKRGLELPDSAMKRFVKKMRIFPADCLGIFSPVFLVQLWELLEKEF